jgi:hypothetical protein
MQDSFLPRDVIPRIPHESGVFCLLNYWRKIMKTFSQLLAAIKKSDTALQEAVQEAVAYVLIQYHRNGRVVDGAKVNLKAQLVEAAPAWLGEKIKKLPLNSGKRDVTMDERRAENMAQAMTAAVFAAQAEVRRIQKEQREARKAKIAAPVVESVESAPVAESEPEIIEGEYVTANPVMYGLVVEGELIEVSEEEALALSQYLMEMRITAFQPLRIAA